ncbi:hypothetical protein L596_005378 [Steinernema carpocapsae]|uniref:Uncharacterized protein n=1 Tax=Steinernema carpocapsae TaxID=34508 RepID=A0A4U8V3E8_STECR|nr:hypothetical protein L596_005378 [Steinernema carpocapsae]
MDDRSEEKDHDDTMMANFAKGAMCVHLLSKNMNAGVGGTNAVCQARSSDKRGFPNAVVISFFPETGVVEMSK